MAKKKVNQKKTSPKEPLLKKGKKVTKGVKKVKNQGSTIGELGLKHYLKSNLSNLSNFKKDEFKNLSAILIKISKSFLLWGKNFRFKRLLKTIFVKDLKIKLVSLLVSLSIFGYVKMQDIEERRIFIPLNLYKIDELELVNTPPEKISIYLSGTRTILGEINIDQLRAHVDLSDISKEGNYVRKPVIEGLDKDVQLLNVSPNTINFELSFLQRRPLKIEPELVGKPNPDYEVSSIRTFPKRVNVLGPRDILKDINKVLTEPIEIGGLKVDKEVEVLLSRNIHPSIKVDLNRKIKVNISVRSKYYKEKLKDTFILNVNLANEDTLISYDFFSISNVEYRVSTVDVEDFDPNEEIKFFVDTKTIKKPGVYLLPVTYVKKSNFKILNFSPKKVEIKVEKVDYGKEQVKNLDENGAAQDEDLPDDSTVPEEGN